MPARPRASGQRHSGAKSAPGCRRLVVSRPSLTAMGFHCCGDIGNTATWTGAIQSNGCARRAMLGFQVWCFPSRTPVFFGILRVICTLLLCLSSSISQLFVSAGAVENNFDPAVDYYRVLGVDERASAADIKHSYKNLARKYHPDVSSEPDATSHFAVINEAYEVLGNERTRSDYDAARAFGKPQYAQFGDAYRGGRGGRGRPTRYTYVHRYQSPGEYYEFVDPRDLYDFYASNERARRSGSYHRNTDFDHAGNHNALKFYDVVNSKLLDILTPICILFTELLVVHTILKAVLVR